MRFRTLLARIDVSMIILAAVVVTLRTINPQLSMVDLFLTAWPALFVLVALFGALLIVGFVLRYATGWIDEDDFGNDKPANNYPGVQ